MIVRSLYGSGKRENNQDYFLIDEALKSFVLSDGVGGAVNGEKASRSLCRYIMNEELFRPVSCRDQMLHNIINIQQGFNKLLDNNPEDAGMAATLVYAKWLEQGMLIAHIGDSRCYHIQRRTRNYWRTPDHSLIDALVREGVIDATEVLNCGMKNIITKAVEANFDNKIVEPDINFIENVSPGDRFLLCSDGVMEALEETDLLNMLFEVECPDQLTGLIEADCQVSSNDNYSAILIETEYSDPFNKQ